MTQEEKAKAYDEVQNKLRFFMAQGVDPLITRSDDIDNKFIRMRETKPANIAEFLDRLTTVEQEFLWEHIAKIRELDKEEQKPTDKVEPKFKVGQMIKKEGFNLGFIIVKIEDGFYYNDMGDYFPFTDQDNWELVEQNPAWSGEDENILNTIINHFKVDIECTDEDDIVRWLKSLKGRVQPQPKQEWNKEDENLYDFLLGELNASLIDYCGAALEDMKEVISWLKSLKDRYTWEPSDEQMTQLKKYCPDNRPLTSLYEQLKKLKA